MQKTTILMCSLLLVLLPAGLQAQNAKKEFNPELGVTGSLENIPLLARNDCSFIQPSVGSFLMPSKDDKTFRENLARYQHIPIDVFACNSFIPSSMKSVGPEHDQAAVLARSEEHTSELQSLMRISYAVFCL